MAYSILQIFTNKNLNVFQKLISMYTLKYDLETHCSSCHSNAFTP